MKIIFCKDGILRTSEYNTTKLLPLTYIQELMQMNDSFTFLSRFLTQEVIFEKGLTFNNFFKCLEPWSEFWETYTQTYISEYIKVGRTPRILKKHNYIAEVEFSKFLNIQQSVTPIFRNSIVYSNDIETIINSKHKDELEFSTVQNFVIDNQHCLLGYTEYSPQLSIDISEVPYYQWMNAQFTLKRASQIIFNEDGLKDIMDMQNKRITSKNVHNLVFSNNMLNLGGNHVQINDGFIDSSFSFVEGEAFFTLEQVIRNIFNILPTSVVQEDTVYSNLIYDSIYSVLNGTVKFEPSSNQADVIYSLTQSKLINYYEKDTIPEKEETKDVLKLIDEIVAETQAVETSSIVPFSQKSNIDSESELNTVQNNSDNIVSFNNFKNNSDEKKSSIIPIVAPEITDNSYIFSKMIEYAQEDNEELLDSNTIFNNEPHKNRIMGVLCDNLMPYLNIEEFEKNLKD